MLNEFTNYLNIQGKPETTISAYRYDLNVFFEYINEKKKKILKTKETDLYDFFEYLTEKGLKPITRARYCSSLKKFFEFLYSYGKIKTNPVDKLHKPKIDKKESIYLLKDEAIKLLNNTKKRSKRHSRRNYAIMYLFLNLGIRLDELVKINFEDIDFIDQKIRIHGKGQKERILYLNKNCISAIINYTNRKSGAVFLSERGNRISRREVQHIVKTEIESAGLNDKISAHKLRHTCATLLYENGTDLRCLQKILGHENISTTEIYTHVKNEQMKKAINRIGEMYEKLQKRN